MQLGELKPPLSITHKVMATPEKQLLSTQLTKERYVFLVFSFPLLSAQRSVASALYKHIFVERCLKCDGAKRCASHINTQETLSAPPLPARAA